MRLIFVRHGEAEGNINRTFHGWTDAELTERGHLQAQKAAERLADFDIEVMYSSSLKRALQTAEHIAKVKNLTVIRTDKLKEINGGDWEGELFEQLPIKWPEEYNTWENNLHIHKMPNGESMEEFQHRLVEEVKYIIKNNKDKNICIVTHGTAIRALVCYFYGYELEKIVNIPWYDNTAITMVEYNEDKFKVLMAGDASHLEHEHSTIQNQEWWVEYKRNFEEKQRNNS